MTGVTTSIASPVAVVIAEAYPPSRQPALARALRRLARTQSPTTQARHRSNQQRVQDLGTLSRNQLRVAVRSAPHRYIDSVNFHLLAPQPSLNILAMTFLTNTELPAEKRSHAAIAASCERWVRRKFPGRFSRLSTLPCFRIFIIEQGSRHTAGAWRSTEHPGYYIGTLSGEGSTDVFIECPSSHPVPPDLLSFVSDHALLFARIAESELLGTYRQTLVDLRDRAADTHRTWHLLRRLKKLETFLIQDGLDSSVVALDAKRTTLDDYRLGLPRYDMMGIKLEQVLSNQTLTRAEDLELTTSTTISGIQAASNLRLAIANISLQRYVLVLTLLTVVLAVLSLSATLVQTGVAR